VVRPGESIEVEIRPCSNKISSVSQLSNRVSIRKGRRLVILSYQRESRLPLVHRDLDLSGIGDLASVADRSFLNEGEFFLKQKFMNTSNAKNFLVGSNLEMPHASKIYTQ